jgi:hypothetical protein
MCTLQPLSNLLREKFHLQTTTICRADRHVSGTTLADKETTEKGADLGKCLCFTFQTKIHALSSF